MFNHFDFLKKLISVSPRFAENELKAAEIIKSELSENNISFQIQPFQTAVPQTTKAELIIDGQNIPCMGSSLVSGDIPDGKYLVSHFGYSGDHTPYNIAYSPVTDDISVVDHLEIPSITISRKDIVKVVMGKDIHGRVEVEKKEFSTENILVGNLKNPKNIVFSHFDSIVKDGAVDNGAGVSVLMKLALQKNIINDSLLIFSGNEEISYDDYSHKSGYGFRVFEKDYKNILLSTHKIFVIDGIGLTKANFSQAGLDWVLQLRCLDDVRSKVYWLQNDQSEILKYFHTIHDSIENLSEAHIESAYQLLYNQLV